MNGKEAGEEPGAEHVLRSVMSSEVWLITLFSVKAILHFICMILGQFN